MVSSVPPFLPPTHHPTLSLANHTRNFTAVSHTRSLMSVMVGSLHARARLSSHSTAERRATMRVKDRKEGRRETWHLFYCFEHILNNKVANNLVSMAMGYIYIHTVAWEYNKQNIGKNAELLKMFLYIRLQTWQNICLNIVTYIRTHTFVIIQRHQ